MQGFSFWLLPTESTLAPYKSLSIMSQNQMDACALPLHVTLYVGSLENTDIDSVLAFGKEISTSMHQQQLHAIDFEVEAQFGKSAYLRFNYTPEMLDFYQKCLLKFETPYQLDPHLSLYYKEGELSKKREQIQQMFIPQQILEFDHLCLARHPKDIKGVQDIAAFEIIAKWSI